jgi:tungstate transport system substrate-binding protein
VTSSSNSAALAARRRPALIVFSLLALSVGLLPAAARAQPASIVMASTTSTEQSGLLAYVLPRFTRETGIEVRVVAVGSGQAMDIGRRGDADILLVHDRAAEDKFVADGFATERRDVMTNDFVIVGPRTDPAGIRGRDATAAMGKLATARQPVISRGDRSGTHAAELNLWASAKVNLAKAKPEGYRECGCGMGQALNMASSTDAYTLTDRGTWLSFRNRANLVVLVEGDAQLFNPYGVMVVNPKRHTHVKAREAQALADWLVSPAGQQAIRDFKVQGEPLFFPSAKNDKAGGTR